VLKAVLSVLVLSVSLSAGEFTTFIGGTAFPPYPYTVTAMTTDAAGNTYLTGLRTLSPLYATMPGHTDCFVSKVDPAGKIVFTDVFAGQGKDQVLAIAVDPAGDVYVGGTTTSPDFPLTNALQRDSPNNSDGAGFLMKLSPDGRTILYSTYFGGILGNTTVYALATDNSGNLYATGTTGAPDFPKTPGMPAAPLVGPTFTAVFITEISGAGDRILYSGDDIIPVTGNPFHGGAQVGTGIAVDAGGDAWVAGSGGASGNSFDGQPFTGNVFAFEVKAGGKGVAWSKSVASGSSCQTFDMAIDSAGDVYAAGITTDPNLPQTGGTVGPQMSGSGSGFVMKFKADGTAILWSTYLGDEITSIAAGPNGDLFAVGTTTSSEFPNPDGWSATGQDFLVELNPSGTTLLYSGRYPNGTISKAVALDGSGLIHAAGPTGLLSAIAPGQPPLMRAFGAMNAAGGAMTGNLTPGEVIAIYGPHIGPATPVVAKADSSGMLPTTLGGVQVTIGARPAPLLYVSDGQINAIVPPQDSNESPPELDLQIRNGNNTSPGFRTVNVASMPAVFADAAGNAIAVNQDGTLNSASNPGKAGSVVAIWTSGLQSFSPVGGIATSANNYCAADCLVVLNPEATPSEWNSAKVQYAGTSPGTANAVLQINFVVPALDVNQTQLYFAVALQGSATLSDLVTIYVTP
jgi:uncharacterized protein (TIGR03437 family)